MNMNRIYRLLVIGFVVSIFMCILIYGTYIITDSSSGNFPDWVIIVGLILSGLALVGIFLFPIIFLGVWIGSYFTRKSEAVYPLQKFIKDEPTITDKRIESLANIPNVSFHFANRDEVESLYNDYFKEPTIEQVVSEIAGEVSGEASSRIPKFVEAKFGGKDFSKWVSTIKIPDVSTEEKFRRYQRQTIINGQVNLGLELVDIDLTELNKFENLLLEMKSAFGVNIENVEAINNQREILRQKAAEKTIIRLENATGQVLIDGKFIVYELNTEFYKCTYEHPVSQYLIGQKNKITIGVILRKDAIESNIAGNYAQAIGKSIPLKAYGKVWQPVDRSNNIWELQITPLAVYQ